MLCIGYLNNMDGIVDPFLSANFAAVINLRYAFPVRPVGLGDGALTNHMSGYICGHRTVEPKQSGNQRYHRYTLLTY